MKRNILGLLLVVLFYGVIFLLVPYLGINNPAISSVLAKVYYPLRVIQLRQLGLITGRGVIRQSEADDRWILSYAVPKKDAAGTTVHGIMFRIPTSLSQAEAATAGKVVAVTLGQEPDADHFGLANYVLRSVTLSP